MSNRKIPKHATASEGFPIVGIGASAGGLEALEGLLKVLPVETGVAFIVVVHLDPTHVSLLPDLLGKRTNIPVLQIEDGMRVRPNHLYVIPPNSDLSILNGSLQLMELPQPRGGNLPIDNFLRSLAQDQEERAVCIILSGTGTDGSLGAKAIKGQHGMVMVQDQNSAKYDGMPRSAAATGVADYVLPPAEMPKQLMKYLRHSWNLPPATVVVNEPKDVQSLQKVFVILRARTNHDFSHYKKNTICRRIERRMSILRISELSDYVAYLQKSDGEVDILFKDLLIGVTNFFRDKEAFAALRVAVKAMLAAKDDDGAVRVWVAGCASGEEAYSLAILLHECMEEVNRGFHVQVFATDLDENAISVARAGLYPTSIEEHVSPERIERYFQKEDGQYRVRKMIREMVVFAEQNLIKDPPFTKLDLLSCRNLLIYLGPVLQKKLLPLFHYSVKEDGILFLGSSETIGAHTDLFHSVNKKWKIFQRMSSERSTHPILYFTPPRELFDSKDTLAPELVHKAEELSALQLAETILLQSHTPPCVIINDACNVVYIHGRTGKFLEPAEGKASVNIIEMARQGLRNELNAAIRQVSKNKLEAVYPRLRIENEGSVVQVKLTVRPVLQQVSMRGLMMVVFEETSAAEFEAPALLATGKSKTVQELERELLNSRESLQTTIEELETSNEEQKSTNEELQSTNEELQSTNEELETSKEELQSLNEESSTVNTELQARIDELSKINDDMKNLLDSTNIATIFLDTELRVRRFTPSATQIVPLAAVDVGRPISNLVCSLNDADLTTQGELVLKDLGVRESEVDSVDGRHWVMRVSPYRTVANVIDGVVMTFEDRTERKRQERAISESVALYRKLFDRASNAIALVDCESGQFLESNDAAFKELGYSQEQFSHLRVKDIDVEHTIAQLCGFVEAEPNGGPVTFVSSHKSKIGKIRKVTITIEGVVYGERTCLLCAWIPND
tara:strand:+ start:24643 stop:27531 length:2889 start_codon:yes stop_codon:yes gene_type:complete